MLTQGSICSSPEVGYISRATSGARTARWHDVRVGELGEDTNVLREKGDIRPVTSLTTSDYSAYA